MTRLLLQEVCAGSLKGVNLALAAGEIVGLSGPSGSGKSRLLRAVADLDPHGGEVFLDGQPQDSIPGHIWRQRVMMVPADSQWWFDHVGAHFPDGAGEFVAGALGFSAGVMDWPVSRLSSGERQRLAILRALSRQPRVLLLDEPSANLDDDMTQQLEHWLLAQIRRRELGVIWVAHDHHQLDRVSDRQAFIRGDTLELAHDCD